MSTPWTMPSFAQPGTVGQRQDVVTLHDRVTQITDRMDQWQLQQLATETGELAEVLSLPDGAALTTLHPRTQHMASPRFTSNAPTSQQIAITASDASRLFNLTTGLQWIDIGPGGGSIQRQAFGRLIGHTPAVPIVVHWLPDRQEWLCIGGIIQQAQQGGQWARFTVDTTRIVLARGLLGIMYKIKGGTGDNAHWITEASWAALSNDGLGHLPRNAFFSPLYAVSSTDPLTLTVINGVNFNPSLVLPAPGFERYPRCTPTSPVGIEPS